MASLLYGAGLRLMECVRLRVKDVDFAYQQITVRHGKGGQDRVTMLPLTLQAPLQRHLARVKLVHEEDLVGGYGEVHLPYAFARKDPHAGTSWEWQYVFPAAKRSIDPRSGVERRHHVSHTVLQKVVKEGGGRKGNAIALPRIGSKMATISVPYRNCSGIKMSARRCFIRTCCSAAAKGYAARSTHDEAENSHGKQSNVGGSWSIDNGSETMYTARDGENPLRRRPDASPV